MAYNRENYLKIKEAFERKRAAHRAEADARLRTLHERFPELCQIDAALSETGRRVFEEIQKGKDGIDARMAALREENLELQAIRARFLSDHGYPTDYTDVVYDCPLCRDAGSIGTKMCECFRRELIYAGYESSGIGSLIREQSFDNFSLAYYQSDAHALDLAENALRICRDFAEQYTPGKNLLLRGETGLGKTHLSTSVARVLIDRGLDAVYETAPILFGDFEAVRFGHTRGDEDLTQKYFDCDLLIIDDLGTELSNQFTISVLYHLINTRLNHRRSTIINTNLSWAELRQRYSDRITSRLFGEFTPVELAGKDIRQQKLAF